MWADHHVLAVRNLLGALPGISDIEASSTFRTVTVVYDPTKIAPEAIKTKLAEAGYPADGGEAMAGETVYAHPDPAWLALSVRETRTNVVDLQMSGDFRKY
jgi:copper chaperone CopZ